MKLRGIECPISIRLIGNLVLLYCFVFNLIIYQISICVVAPLALPVKVAALILT